MSQNMTSAPPRRSRNERGLAPLVCRRVPAAEGIGRAVKNRERSPTRKEIRPADCRRKLCPGLCPNWCLPSTNTVTYGETRRETTPGQVVETTAENVIRYVSTLLQRSAFQACLIDHSSISPL